MSTIGGAWRIKPEPYALVLRESVGRFALSQQSDPGFQRYLAKNEFWTAFRRYRLKVQAEARLAIATPAGNA